MSVLSRLLKLTRFQDLRRVKARRRQKSFARSIDRSAGTPDHRVQLHHHLVCKTLFSLVTKHFALLTRYFHRSSMALPVVKNVLDCADFSKTVLPYTFQLRELPYQIFDSISNPQALKQIYLDTNPVISAFAFSLFLSPIFLVVSEINKNYSQVDRCWSILPTVYLAHFTAYAHLVGLETTRLDTLLACSCVWSVCAFPQ